MAFDFVAALFNLPAFLTGFVLGFGVATGLVIVGYGLSHRREKYLEYVGRKP